MAYHRKKLRWALLKALLRRLSYFHKNFSRLWGQRNLARKVGKGYDCKRKEGK